MSESLSFPEARSQILITLSAAPVANHSFPGSMAQHLTQPVWPEMTRYNFQGGCHLGLGIVIGFLGCSAVELQVRVIFTILLLLRDYTDPTKCVLENDLAEHQFFSRVATSASQRATREKN